MSRILFLFLSLFFAGIATAQVPKLDQGAPTICRVNYPSEEWLPSPNEIAELERALPAYLASLAQTQKDMPMPDVEYARQYSGIVRDGKKYIHGRYFPASSPRPSFAKAGGCWMTMDGGSQYWSVTFDPESGKIISHTINGIA